MFIGQIMMHVK